MSLSLLLIFLIINAASTAATTRRLQRRTVRGKCNDGSPAIVFTAKATKQSQRALVYLQGGGYCFSKGSCALRWHDSPRLMSSTPHQESTTVAGFLADEAETTDITYVVYCSSDSFSGNSTAHGWTFDGATIVRGLFEDGVVDLRSVSRLVFAGSSAGAEGMFPHYNWLSDWTAKHAPAVKLVGLLDSGLFLDATPLHAGSCKQLGVCTEQGGLIDGVPMWSAVLDEACEQSMGKQNRWKCMLGETVLEFLPTNIMVMEFLFDAAQLGHDGIYHVPQSAQELTYAQENARNVTQRALLWQQRGGSFFLPACYKHTVLEDAAWLDYTAGGWTLQRAFENMLNGFQVGVGDTCMTPNCTGHCH